ncbi:MAG: hypothetical protein K5751_06545 [Treponemataceae bacterium]|nr:hypothetical protein [Treponemataceae bacterium]
MFLIIPDRTNFSVLKKLYLLIIWVLVKVREGGTFAQRMKAKAGTWSSPVQEFCGALTGAEQNDGNRPN